MYRNNDKDRHIPRKDGGDDPIVWLDAGIRLVIDCFKALFKKKAKDETWNEFITIKVGSLLLICFGLFLIAGALSLFYSKVFHTYI